MTRDQFKQQYPNEYKKLSDVYWDFVMNSGWDLLGSDDIYDLADWLSATAEVDYSIAKKYIELFI